MYKWGLRLFCAMAGISIGLGGYTFYYAQGYSYMSNDPKACVNCHIMREEYNGWLKSGHHGFATCNDCHLPAKGLMKWAIKAENGFWHSKSFTFQDFAEPIRVRPHNKRVILDNCVRCHQGLVDHITPPAGSREEGDGCVKCHSSVGHGARE